MKEQRTPEAFSAPTFAAQHPEQIFMGSDVRLIETEAAPKLSPAFTLDYHGHLGTLKPLSTEAQLWCDEHIPKEAPTWGWSVVVDHAVIGPLLDEIA